MTSVPNTTFPTSINAGGSFSMENAQTIASAAGNALGALAQNSGGTQVPDSSTQQSVDAVLGSVVPFYSLGNAIGDIAAKDYKNISLDPTNPEEFGKIINPDKYDVASTIGGFFGPDNLISGLSGEGWTAGQRRAHIEEKYAPQRKALLKQKEEKWNMENRQINPGRFYDTNQMMSAQFGGVLPEGTQAQNGLPQITEYNSGQTHDESLTGGIPVDSEGNAVAVSGKRPVALTESGEVGWKSPSGETYIFSNKLTLE